jgi:murein DD-endopeptidase MepM/ murein hydrolase activator NlpD
VRFFPRAPRSRLLAALAAGVVLAGIIAIPAAQADDEKDLRDKQKSVQGQISSTNADLQESSAAVRSAAAALDSARTRLTGAKSHLVQVNSELEAAQAAENLLQVELDQTVAQLATAQQDLVAGTAATAAQRQVVADTITDIYTQGDPQLLAFAAILDAKTPADVTRQMNFQDVVVGKEDTAYADLGAAEGRLAEQEKVVEAATVAVTTKRDDAAANVDQVEGLRAAAQAAELDITSLVSTRRQARLDATAARAADQAQLDELTAQDAQIKKQILAAKKEAARKAAAAAAAAAAANKPAPATNGLSGGRLLAPVVGPVTSPFGYRIHPIYGYWGLHDGTDFGVACGEGLRASGTGTVMSTVYSSVYGNRLYLDLGIMDGKSITVVYNHMSGYRVTQGDRVQRGDIVGFVGSTGWSTGCHLHFSVLVDGVAVDPMGYL